MHIQQARIFYGQVCPWWPFPLKRWQPGLLGHCVSPLDWERRWLSASICSALVTLWNAYFCRLWFNVFIRRFFLQYNGVWVCNNFIFMFWLPIVWKSMKRRQYLWHWIPRSSMLLPTSSRRPGWPVLCLTQHAGWVVYIVPSKLFVSSNCCLICLPKWKRKEQLSNLLSQHLLQVRNLERAYFKMWNLHCLGQKPQHFKVAENDLEFPYDR